MVGLPYICVYVDWFLIVGLVLIVLLLELVCMVFRCLLWDFVWLWFRCSVVNVYCW